MNQQNNLFIQKFQLLIRKNKIIYLIVWLLSTLRILVIPRFYSRFNEVTRAWLD